MLMSIIITAVASSIDRWHRPWTVTNTIWYHVVPIAIDGGAHWCQYTRLCATERMCRGSFIRMVTKIYITSCNSTYAPPTANWTQYFGINIIKWNIYYIQQSTINGEQYTHTGRTTFHYMGRTTLHTQAEHIHLLGLTTKHSSFGFGITKGECTQQQNNHWR